MITSNKQKKKKKSVMFIAFFKLFQKTGPDGIKFLKV